MAEITTTGRTDIDFLLDYLNRPILDELRRS